MKLSYESPNRPARDRCTAAAFWLSFAVSSGCGFIGGVIFNGFLWVPAQFTLPVLAVGTLVTSTFLGRMRAEPEQATGFGIAVVGGLAPAIVLSATILLLWLI